ncbi:MAG: type II toxin-antitoxin system VapC family toxin [Desulfurococcaceae archaeon]
MKLLDTSVLIENLRKGIFEPGAISVITLIEVLRGINQSKRSEVKKLLEESFEVLPISNQVILKYCEIYDYLRQRGRIISDADLLIAATALVNNSSLVTKDFSFERIADVGLKLELRED